MEMHPVFLFLDPYLIWFYRITGHARIDFIIGTFTLALMAVIVGELNICPGLPGRPAAHRAGHR